MAYADDSLDLDLVWEALTNALDYIGSGAKTGTGYGFMSEDKEINDQTNIYQYKNQCREIQDKLFSKGKDKK